MWTIWGIGAIRAIRATWATALVPYPHRANIIAIDGGEDDVVVQSKLHHVCVQKCIYVFVCDAVHAQVGKQGNKKKQASQLRTTPAASCSSE